MTARRKVPAPVRSKQTGNLKRTESLKAVCPNRVNCARHIRFLNPREVQDERDNSQRTDRRNRETNQGDWLYAKAADEPGGASICSGLPAAVLPTVSAPLRAVLRTNLRPIAQRQPARPAVRGPRRKRAISNLLRPEADCRKWPLNQARHLESSG